MDFRPVDTVNTITTRNIIRVSAMVNLFMVVLYLSIEPYVSGAHMSWLHQIHVIIQPIILFISISESTALTILAILMCLTAAFFDASVTWISYISITRCLNELTASCVQLIWEKGVWVAIGAIVLLMDISLTLRLWSLYSVLTKKDSYEEANKEKYESLSIKPAPLLVHLRVNSSKMRIIHLFLIPFGFIFVFLMLDNAFSDPLHFISFGHLLLDIYGTSVSKIHDKISLIILLVGTVLFGGANIFGFIYRMATELSTVSEELVYLISVLYIFADILIAYFAAENLKLIDTYDKLKVN
tara:strand:+ start:6204 stop:7097 length:894 start_codon:yes stop_codon:yes gene_type:complete